MISGYNKYKNIYGDDFFMADNKVVEIIHAKDKEILEQCLKMRNDVFVIEKKIPKEIEVDEYDSIRDDCDHFLIRHGDKNIGAFRCKHIGNDKIQLQRFCILSDSRKSGFGKNVLAAVENFYRDKNISTVELDAKYGVAGFYEKCGYERISDIFIEAGVEHIKMRKLIDE